MGGSNTEAPLCTGQPGGLANIRGQKRLSPDMRCLRLEELIKD